MTLRRSGQQKLPPAHCCGMSCDQATGALTPVMIGIHLRAPLDEQRDHLTVFEVIAASDAGWGPVRVAADAR